MIYVYVVVVDEVRNMEGGKNFVGITRKYKTGEVMSHCVHDLLSL